MYHGCLCSVGHRLSIQCALCLRVFCLFRFVFGVVDVLCCLMCFVLCFFAFLLFAFRFSLFAFRVSLFAFRFSLMYAVVLLQHSASQLEEVLETEDRRLKMDYSVPLSTGMTCMPTPRYTTPAQPLVPVTGCKVCMYVCMLYVCVWVWVFLSLSTCYSVCGRCVDVIGRVSCGFACVCDSSY